MAYSGSCSWQDPPHHFYGDIFHGLFLLLFGNRKTPSSRTSFCFLGRWSGQAKQYWIQFIQVGRYERANGLKEFFRGCNEYHTEHIVKAKDDANFTSFGWQKNFSTVSYSKFKHAYPSNKISYRTAAVSHKRDTEVNSNKNIKDNALQCLQYLF